MEKKLLEEEARDGTQIYVKVDGTGQEDGIDLVRVATQMGKRKKMFFYLTMFAACAGVLAGVLVTAVQALIGGGAHASAVVAFNFDGIDQGLDPNGAAFDVTRIKSTVVVNGALQELGWEDVSPEEVRANLKIAGIIPDGVKQQIAVINTVAQDAAEYYANVTDLDYFPSQYTVTLQKMKGISAEQTRELLDAILKGYREYFMDTYANTETLSASYNVLDFKNYDYLQAADMLSNEMEVMKNYVDARNEEGADFRAVSTGFSFGDLSSSIEMLTNLDLANFTSFVQSNNLTKDAGTRSDYYNYQIDQYTLQLEELRAQLTTVQNTIDTYEKDPVIVMSSQESVTETIQKNEYYDKLLEQKLELTESIGKVNTDLSRTYVLLDSLADTAASGKEEEYAYADTLLENLLETVKVWSGIVQTTAEEFYNSYFFADAYRISVPAQYSSVDSLSGALKNMALCAGVLVAAVFMGWCADGVKRELKADR